MENSFRAKMERLRDLMDARDDVDERKSSITREMEELKLEIKTELEARGEDKVTAEGIGTVSLLHKIFGKVTNLDAAKVALLELGRDDVFETKPSVSRLNSLAREYVENGLAEPEGIEFVVVDDVRLTRARGTATNGNERD